MSDWKWRQERIEAEKRNREEKLLKQQKELIEIQREQGIEQRYRDEEIIRQQELIEQERRQRDNEIIQQQDELISIERERARNEVEREVNEQIKQLEIEDEEFIKSAKSVKVSFTRAISLDQNWFGYTLACAVIEIEAWWVFIENCLSDLQKQSKTEERIDKVSSILTDAKNNILAIQDILSNVKNEIGDLGNIKTMIFSRDGSLSLEDIKIEERLNAGMLKITEAEELLEKINNDFIAEQNEKKRKEDEQKRKNEAEMIERRKQIEKERKIAERKKRKEQMFSNIKRATKMSCLGLIVIFIALFIYSLVVTIRMEKKELSSKEWACSAKACNIRSGPGKEHSVVRTINQGDKLKCVSFEDDWCKIEAEDEQWIHKSILGDPDQSED